MAEKKIEELPLLDIENFDPGSDFIIVQKANGATYKMLGGGGTFAASVAARKPYADQDIQNMTQGNRLTMTFSEDNLFSLNSAITINMSLEILNHGSNASGGGAILPEVGSSRALSLVKSTGQVLLSEVEIGSSGSGDFAIFKGEKRTTGKTPSVTWYYRTYKYEFSTTQNSFSITFSSSDQALRQSNFYLTPDTPVSALPSYFPANQVKISVSLSGSIVP